MAIQKDDLPSKNGDSPVRYISHYQFFLIPNIDLKIGCLFCPGVDPIFHSSHRITLVKSKFPIFSPDPRVRAYRGDEIQGAPEGKGGIYLPGECGCHG